MKSSVLDIILNGFGERKVVKDVEMVFYLGCIKIICFLGINMIFVIVIDFLKK